MIIIPEIETVVILVPRTGSTSLRKIIADRYPQSMMIWRHMEADGVPHGYDRWRKVGVIRHPMARMMSLYRYLKGFDPVQKYGPEYTQRMRKSVGVPFTDWLINNRETFTSPFGSSGGNAYYPKYACRHPMPENLKSQFIYLRPDLGTEIFLFGEWEALGDRLGITMDLHVNQGEPIQPEAKREAWDHVHKHMEWDLRTWHELNGA